MLLVDGNIKRGHNLMSFQPLIESSWVIQVHAFTAIAAFILGLVQLLAPKGTLPHKAIGVIWVVLMLVIAISSIFLTPSVYGYDLPLTRWFSWIHIFTVITLYWVALGVARLLRGGENFKRHGAAFRIIFLGGLVGAGAFTFLPGRIMYQVIFGVG